MKLRTLIPALIVRYNTHAFRLGQLGQVTRLRPRDFPGDEEYTTLDAIRYSENITAQTRKILNHKLVRFQRYSPQKTTNARKE